MTQIPDITSLRWPQSLRGINSLDTPIKEAIYFSLIPPDVIRQFGISLDRREQLQIICPHDTRAVELRYFDQPDSIDPTFYLHMADTLNNQIAVLLVLVNDTTADRFNIDIDPNGLPTRFGTMRRNIPEEIRAMQAGLSPGQVRRGLRITRQIIPTFEQFIQRTGHDMIIIEPLTYNNAIVYERYGFAYFQGKRRMEWINNALRPDGELFERFDGSTPFRHPDSWASIRGRSWAIHDGILGEPFGDIRMYKRIGHHAGITTFPDGQW
ncbi:MAG: hypothetical protein IT326_02845 [Anaerolineae bacterium]|nr:hypothetical protein [Anaerolineae bacterium]